MSDIVTRLRAPVPHTAFGGAVFTDEEAVRRLSLEAADEIERLRGLLDSIGAVIVGGAGSRRICDGPGSFAPEAGPTYDEIFRAHSEIEKLTDER